ncbi:OmpH family outer membrane protein [Robiginitalea sp. SC105]|uniref:OmpH family outer membrane protein n=1 Tax=Robiginitalea sp. SC105 TaxID=2762332 RepID=UPI00163A6B9D|nr:OmpH family outer membrane protein [Robiginitalea sp. SC105]MBC2838213.1 OmpH family outer membrane protein [Robiginitalea sp. SC105]
MKKLMILAAVVLFSSCQQNKIGFVDYTTLMDGYSKKQELETSYNSRAEAYARKRDSISQAFQMEAQSLQNKSKSMSQQQAQEEYGALQQRGQVIGNQLQQEEQRMQQQGQQKMDSLITEVRERISDFGKNNGYTYILAAGEGGSVLYGAESQDVTEEILKVLNEEAKK